MMRCASLSLSELPFTVETRQQIPWMVSFGTVSDFTRLDICEKGGGGGLRSVGALLARVSITNL